MKIAVLMTCFNRKETTLECLEALKLSIEGSAVRVGACFFDLWLNDDGSTDGTSEAVQKWHDENAPLFTFASHLHLIHGSGHDFWCGGMRRAWYSAANSGIDYDGYLWLNDDTILNEDAIENLLLVNSDVVCGAIKDPETGRCAYGGYDNHRQLVEPNGSVQEVFRITGNVVYVSRIAYNKIGGLRKCWTHAIGDGDYGLTANEAGLRVVTTPKYVGSCHDSNTLAQWMNPKTSFVKRWRNLHSPKGYAEPRLFFYFNWLHYGTFQATRYFVQQYFRVCFPGLWMKLKGIK